MVHVITRFFYFCKVKEKFFQHTISLGLSTAKDKILVAVSGGIDSMVLFHLLKDSGFQVGLAHCNFKLRGKDSDLDEKFVEETALNFKIPFYSTSFDTSRYGREKGISIQMAARELRYDWLEKIRIQNKFNYIAIGHNQNDSVETFLVNLARGTGIRGLTGIKAKKESIVRPLLFAGRKEIENYVKENGILYREDVSNVSTKYKRNKIRHKMIPLFEELNPGFIGNALDTIEKLNDVERVYDTFVNHWKKKLVIDQQHELVIKIDELEKLPGYRSLLFEILQDYHFSPCMMKDIISSLHSRAGKKFYSSSHELVKDRGQLLIIPLENKENEVYIYKELPGQIKEPLHMDFHLVSGRDYRILQDSMVGQFDFDKIKFPLILRKWREGDVFQPLGMRNKKKISDFFVDQKFSLPGKQRAWLLCSGEETNIIWIVGHRIDDRFKVQKDSREVLLIHVNDNS